MKEIPLTQGLVTIVDDDDYAWLSQFKWFAAKARNTFYACRKTLVDGVSRRVMMHRVLLGISDSAVFVDHHDRNGLNNTRLNLRVATRSQNAANQGFRTNTASGFKGVTWNKSVGKWQAQLQQVGKSGYLGVFANQEDAARAYDSAAIKLYGQFARTNFPQGENCGRGQL